MKRWVLAAAAIYAGCGSPEIPHKPAAASTEQVKILAFYPRDLMVTEGAATVLCYGVSNAKSVRIDPPVAGVSPALSRCVEVRPKGETRYTLTAEGSDGQTVSQSCTIRIGTDQAALPKITSFQIDGSQ